MVTCKENYCRVFEDAAGVECRLDFCKSKECGVKCCGFIYVFYDSRKERIYTHNFPNICYSLFMEDSNAVKTNDCGDCKTSP